MITKFILIGLTFIIVGIVLLVAIVRYAMNPLKRLSNTVQHVSMGDYNVRAQVQTNDEVGVLARDFNLMAEAIQSHITQLKETAERQKLFIGGLTHEFKTPLTALIGHSETLLNTKQPENVVNDSLGFIHERCKWLEKLMQKLLKLITLREEIELKPEAVLDLFSFVQDDVNEVYKRRNIELLISCEIELLPMDFDLMRSALINLCDNAAKASESGQSVLLTAHDCMIEVIDDGCGIAQDQISYITEPFYMVDRSRTKNLGGVGLGLALVKQIAEAHNAELRIESAIGQGTRIQIIFPKTIY